MPPKASTSKLPATAQAVKPPAASAAKKLTALEKRIYEFGLKQDGMILTQEALASELGEITADVLDATNSLGRKRLLSLRKLPDGSVLWNVIEVKTVQTQSALTDECILVLDMVKQAGDKAVWIKSIKERTLLPQKDLDKSIKQLEAQKLIRSIKSIKFPTRKMYILEGLAPSIELTGGPWYSGSDFDSALIAVLLDVVTRYINEQSANAEANNDRTIYRLDPAAHTPYLPSAYDVTQYIRSTKCTSAQLEKEHIEELLEVLRLDHVIERIKVQRQPGDYDSEDESIDAAVGQKRALTNGHSKGKQKDEHRRKRIKRDGSENLDNPSSDDGEDDYEDGRLQRVGPPGRSKFYYVYRAVPQRNDNLDIFIGLVDGVCGKCPVASTCDNKGKPAFEDRSLSDVGSVAIHKLSHKANSAANAKAIRERDKLLLALKPPGSIVLGDSGPWSGGGTRGKQKIGPVNPVDCQYFDKWFEQPDVES